MKKLLVILASFLMSIPCYAINPGVWFSTNTATADTTKALCITGMDQTVAGKPKGVVHGLCVNTGAAGTFTIYNSSATSANPVAAINTATAGCFYYDVYLSSGVTYTNSATANVTLLYQCY